MRGRAPALAPALAGWANDGDRLGPTLYDALAKLSPGNLDPAADALDDRVLAALRGEPLSLACSACHHENRLPRFPPRGKRAVCRACRTVLEV